MVLSKKHGDGSYAIHMVDFSNALNMVDWFALLREVGVGCPSLSLWIEFFHGHTTRLYLGDKDIMSSIEVQNGVLLRPLIFALVLHQLIH